MQVVFQDPFGSLSPRMCVSEIVGEGLRIHKMGTRRAGSGDYCGAEGSGLDPNPAPLPPRVFRWAAPAHRHCPGAGAEAGADSAGRADRRWTARCSGRWWSCCATAAKYNLTYLFISHDLAVVSAEPPVDGDQAWAGGGTRDAQAIFHAPQHPIPRQLLEAAFLRLRLRSNEYLTFTSQHPHRPPC
jgi:microcin C transport system ATP-binding protein